MTRKTEQKAKKAGEKEFYENIGRQVADWIENEVESCFISHIEFVAKKNPALYEKIEDSNLPDIRVVRTFVDSTDDRRWGDVMIDPTLTDEERFLMEPFGKLINVVRNCFDNEYAFALMEMADFYKIDGMVSIWDFFPERKDERGELDGSIGNLIVAAAYAKQRLRMDEGRSKGSGRNKQRGDQGQLNLRDAIEQALNNVDFLRMPVRKQIKTIMEGTGRPKSDGSIKRYAESSVARALSTAKKAR